MSSFVFRETLMTHLLLWGSAYARIIRNGKGEVIARLERREALEAELNKTVNKPLGILTEYF